MQPHKQSDNPLVIEIEPFSECCICLEITHKPMINIQDIDGLKRCKCVAYVHAKCLIKWYENKKNRKCIICNSSIITTSQASHQIESTPATPSTQPPLGNRQINRCNQSGRIGCYLIVIICFILFLITVNPDIFHL